VNLTLTRTSDDGTATLGQMPLGGKILYSIELPWKNDLPDVSCIPVGRYDLIPYYSPKHGQTYLLQNYDLGVGDNREPRSYCELHSADWASELRGCIAFGFESYPMLNPATGNVEPAVEESRDAIVYLNIQLGTMHPGHSLQITGPP